MSTPKPLVRPGSSRPGPLRSLALLILAPILLATAPGAQADLRVDAVRARFAGDLVGELEGFVTWCQKQKLYAERDAISAKIIEISPDHEESRKYLGHKRDRDGKWKVPAKHRASRNFDEEALPEMKERRGRIVGGYTGRILAFYGEHEADLNLEERDRLFADVLRFDPGNAVVRGIYGEVDVDGKWTLVETIRARERGPFLARVVLDARGDFPAVEQTTLDETEQALGVTFTHSIAAPFVRVHGTGAPEEPQEVAVALWVTRALFTVALGVEADYGDDFRVYLLTEPKDKRTFLALHPAIDDGYRSFLTQLEGSMIQGTTDFGLWSEDRGRRIDASVRFAVAWLGADAFGLSTRQGWLYEGLGFYSTLTVLGTRLNWFVRPSQYDQKGKVDVLRQKLMEPEIDWLVEGYLLLADKSFRQDPLLDRLLRKDLNALETRELLYAYVLTVYLIEGRPDDAPKIVERIGRTEDPRVVLEDALGFALPNLERRLVRWLDELGIGEKARNRPVSPKKRRSGARRGRRDDSGG